MDADLWLEELEHTVRERLNDRGAVSPRGLTVLYDPGCAFCRRCRAWMLGQPGYVPLAFLAATAPEAVATFGELPWLGDELVVVGDGGEVWVGPAAFLTCLWALKDWREWSYRLASPTFAPLAERFFAAISSRRRAIAALLHPDDCADGACRTGRAVRP